MKSIKNFVLMPALLSAFIFSSVLPSSLFAMSEEPKEDSVNVRYDILEKALDGDTLIFKESGEARLIGVDCGEMTTHKKDLMRIEENDLSQAAYETTKMRAKQFIEDHAKDHRVKLVSDSAHNFRDGEDHLERQLIYLYVDDVFINAELIKRGFCVRQSEIHYDKQDEFKRLQEEAKASKQGIWSDKNPILL